MLVKTFGCAVYGIDAILITIEVNVVAGAKFFMVGLPDSAVKESEHRIQAALKNVGYRIPGKRITVNMAPADIRKEGSAYDLPIAVGILTASQQIQSKKATQYMLMGELALDGQLRPVKGALSMASKAKELGFKGIILPKDNQKEAAVVDGIEVYGVTNISEVIRFFDGEPLTVAQRFSWAKEQNASANELDFADVKGQENVKRALEIAAAGGHNVLLIGPPGSGKSMLARRMPTILPPLSFEEALETTKIHSVAGLLQNRSGLVRERPFRVVHQTSSGVALIGGGSNPKPGEISLAHNGILFLDELPEFSRQVLEVMRQPLEDRTITISRARQTVNYPANFMLVAAMNPSPSGDFYDPNSDHPDSDYAVRRYLNKISGPLLDRIDLHVEVNPVPYEELSSKRKSETSSEVRNRVIKARELQRKRYNNQNGIYTNAQLTPQLIERHCVISEQGEQLLRKAMEKLGFSARSYGRIFKVARTIADLEGVKDIEVPHLAEAIQYRSLDREGWLL